jgi:inorganic pyrophosphatase
MSSVQKTEVQVFIEVEKFSNQKFELNKLTGSLDLDRVLPYPYFFPHAYGFITNTLAMDEDDLDALIITNVYLKNNFIYTAYIVGVLIMEDEKGLDEKIICVLGEDAANIKDITDLSEDDIENIKWFFENYKKKSPGKWSTVLGFENREIAVDLYKKYKIDPASRE